MQHPGVGSDGFLRLAIVWIAGGVILGLLASRTMTVFTGILMLPFWMLYATAGIALLIVAGFRISIPHFRTAALLALALLLAFVASMALGWRELTALGDTVEFRIRFAWLEPTYASHLPAIIHRARNTTVSQSEFGIDFVVDSGPPVRVAFSQGGLLDNWEGIVYDPSGVVSQAKGWRFDHGTQDFTAPPAVRRLFGGDLVECHLVRGPWYRCWFT